MNIIFIGQPQNECQINHPHPYVYQTWKFGQDRSNTLWENQIFAYCPESCNFHLVTPGLLDRMSPILYTIY